ncbi:hypothetical protein [Streptomyces sp. NPDC057002]|uniref:hypothetical protein n=1 Tax=Streptomyces sp. NPDC057002 TaxID=3345992 RepID=UPI00362B4927
MAGSISGGCVDGDVYELRRRPLAEDGPPEYARFDSSDTDTDTDAWAAVLMCGGSISVYVQPPTRSSPLATASPTPTPSSPTTPDSTSRCCGTHCNARALPGE